MAEHTVSLLQLAAEALGCEEAQLDDARWLIGDLGGESSDDLGQAITRARARAYAVGLALMGRSYKQGHKLQESLERLTDRLTEQVDSVAEGEKMTPKALAGAMKYAESISRLLRDVSQTADKFAPRQDLYSFDRGKTHTKSVADALAANMPKARST